MNENELNIDEAVSSDEKKTLVKENREKRSTTGALFIVSLVTSVITALIFICVSFLLNIHRPDNTGINNIKNNISDNFHKNIETKNINKTKDISQVLNAVVTVAVENVGGFLNQSATLCSGNGVFINDNGYILTSAYIFEVKGDITVTAANGDTFTAEVVDTDEENYVSVIKIEQENTPYVSLGNSQEVNIGDGVIGIGNKISSGFSNPVTTGTICGYNSDIALKDGTLVNVFQTDAVSIASSIGGLLFNKNYELIGFSTAKYTVSSTNIGLVTPIDDIKRSIDIMLGNAQETESTQLGIQGSDESYGINVDNIKADSKAEKAGLKHGDLIVKIDGEPVNSLAEIIKRNNSLSKTDEMILTIYRNGEIKEITINGE